MTKDQNLIEPTMNQNENVRLHKCDICENILKTNQGLVRHLKCVHSEEEHKCNVCSKNFQTKVNLKMHMKVLHGRNKRIKCDSCGKSLILHNYVIFINKSYFVLEVQCFIA